jgi:SAM-dependent methyltransferase
MAKALRQSLPVGFVKLGSLLSRAVFQKRYTVTTDYQIISSKDVLTEKKIKDAWKDQGIPQAQRAIVNTELSRMYKGDIIPIYRILAEAVRMTGCENSQIIEVGCASGYYSEVLPHLLQHPIKYIGVDYSQALIQRARQYYPDTNFLLGDASALPFGSKMADILISGCVLLHMADYQQGIAESVRVSRKWVIFHRTPVVDGPTMYYTKLAYGVKCLEIAFGQDDLRNLFRENGLTLVKSFEISQNMVPCTSYKGWGMTYLCKIN